ncbi:aldehyde dehydrogenase family 16 member A1-like [Paramacrobiotus metropolitanus]|uniref:aldehyde dehydrogenase family 16 member A1-like n=1 Tax=Paramacrobiotus metropolitanus TaxID=2943436 RepID=UPI0024459876|nr:aldehyde dehydrogenase family 16 member A1-like [Paramacrobiotus metropolitanus]
MSAGASSTSTANVGVLFKAHGLPYSTSMESTDPLKAWFSATNNLIQPVVEGQRVDSGNRVQLENLVDLAWISGVQVAITDTKAQTESKKVAEFCDVKKLASLAQIIQKNQTVFGLALTGDSGRHISECGKHDIISATKILQFFSLAAQELLIEKDAWHPVGSVDIAVPQNSPLAALLDRLCPAIITGNCVRLVSPVQTARSVTILMDCLAQAGIKNVDFLVVQTLADWKGSGDVLDLSLLHLREVSSLSFPGYKHIIYPGYGRSAAIVADTADVSSAANSIVNAVLFHNGQSKSCPSKIVVQESIYEKFVDAVRARAQQIRFGSPLDKSADWSWRTDTSNAKKLNDHVKQAQSEGAEIVFLGQMPALDKTTDKFVSFPAVIVSNVGTTSVFLTDQYRGPAAVLLPFRTLKEAVSLTNNGPFGHSISIWAENITGAMELAKAVRAATVWINGCHVYDVSVGQGGSGASGWGVRGREALYEFLSWRTKSDANVPVAEQDKEAAMTLRKYGKFYYGNGLKSADSGSMQTISFPRSQLGKFEAPIGSSKDIKSAIEIAVAGAVPLGKTTGVSRGQLLITLAEGMVARANDFLTLLRALSPDGDDAQREFDATVERLKILGNECARGGGYCMQLNETISVTYLLDPCGVIGVALPEKHPLISLTTVIGTAVANGNCVVAVPALRSSAIALEFCQVLSSAGVPAGAINIVTGNQSELMESFKIYPDVSTVWLFEEVSSQNNRDAWADEKGKRIWRPVGIFDSGNEWSGFHGNLFRNYAVKNKRIWINSLQSFVN